MSSSSHCPPARRAPNSATVDFTALVSSEDSAAAESNCVNMVSGKKLIAAIEAVVEVDSELPSSAVDIPSSCEITEIKGAEIEHDLSNSTTSTEGDSTGI